MGWLIDSPLFLLFLTLGAYRLGCEIRDRTGGHALAQPVLIAIVLIGTAISLLDVDYSAYRSANEIIAFWLGPATVALAVPLHRQAHRLRGFLAPLVTAIVLGATVSIVTAYLLVRWLGGDDLLATTMAPKSATTPVALAIAQSVGGIAALAAVFAIVVGILGAVLGPWTLDRLRIRDIRARGLALGSVSHGIGTSRALRESETEGAFSGLAMGLTALATSLLVPLLLPLLR